MIFPIECIAKILCQLYTSILSPSPLLQDLFHSPPPKGASIRNAERDLQTPGIPARSQPALDRAPTDSQGSGAIDRGPLARLPLTEARKSAQFLALAGRCEARAVIHEDGERGPIGELREEAAGALSARIAAHCSVNG